MNVCLRSRRKWPESDPPWRKGEKLRQEVEPGAGAGGPEVVGVGAKGSKCSTSFSGAATAAEGTVLEGEKIHDVPTREFRVSKRVSASSPRSL